MNRLVFALKFPLFLGRYTPYSLYLSSFVEQHADLGFEEIADVLKRYWTLRTSNESMLLLVQQVLNF